MEGVKDYAIFLLDPDGRVTSWNVGGERIKGYTAEEILGQHFSRFYPKEAIEQGWPDRELEVAREEGRFEDEGWRLRKDGSPFWANVIVTALRDEAGGVRGFLKINRDLTAQRQAEEMFRGLLESAPDAMVVVDQRVHVVLVNGQTERLFGYGREELVGQPIEMLVPDYVPARHVGRQDSATGAGGLSSLVLWINIAWVLRGVALQPPAPTSRSGMSSNRFGIRLGDLIKRAAPMLVAPYP